MCLDVSCGAASDIRIIECSLVSDELSVGSLRRGVVIRSESKHLQCGNTDDLHQEAVLKISLTRER